MKVTYQKHRDLTLDPDAQAPTEIETVTIDFHEKMVEYLQHLENKGMRVKRIMVDHNFYTAMKETTMYREAMSYSTNTDEKIHDTIYGVKIIPENLGTESIGDFIIFTDRKTVHSDMIEKDFVEDMEVEELIHETNNRIEEREE